MISQRVQEPADRVENIRNVRLNNLPYLIIWVVYYAWVIAFATWWTAAPRGDAALTGGLRSLMHAANLIASAGFVFFVQKRWFVWLSRTSALFVTAGILAFFLTQNTELRTALAVMSSIAAGCLNICILLPFVFTLNNTEKLYALVGAHALIQLISFVLARNAGKPLELAFSFFMLATSLAATWFFRYGDLVRNSAEDVPAPPKLPKRIYLTIALSCAFAVLCKGAGKGILNAAEAGAGASLETWHAIGGFIGCALFVGLFFVSKKAYLWQANMTFAFVAMGLFCNAFADRSAGFAAVFAVLLGAGNSMGMINMYYIMGVVGKKYDSMRYVRLSILLIGICGGVSGVVVGNLIGASSSFAVSIASSLISAAVLIAIILASPFIAQSGYENDWARDARRSEVGNEERYLFGKYGLSRRETEVCKLLLKGLTLRQISGILSLAYPTINTYCTSLYRKVGINSRAELMHAFKDYIDHLAD